jgi:hypothetical protein
MPYHGTAVSVSSYRYPVSVQRRCPVPTRRQPTRHASTLAALAADLPLACRQLDAAGRRPRRPRFITTVNRGMRCKACPHVLLSSPTAAHTLAATPRSIARPPLPTCVTVALPSLRRRPHRHTCLCSSPTISYRHSIHCRTSRYCRTREGSSVRLGSPPRPTTDAH